MIFAVRQLQEKCREQYKDLYLTFIDLTKAFDTVDRNGLWSVFARIGCPDNVIHIIRAFHDDMTARVVESGEFSQPFKVSSGTKQGCVLAPLLFSIYFSAMLLVAFKDCDTGVSMYFRTDRSVFNLQKLHAKTKVSHAILRDFLFADDCALASFSIQEAQLLLDRFVDAARRFGLSVSLKKTEVMYQPSRASIYSAPSLVIGNQELPVANKFCYLGSVICNDVSLDCEISSRIAKAAAAFGRLTKRLWNEHGVKVFTKVRVYHAAVITTLLYGCETWTLYRRQVKLLENFHMRCLRQILHVTWQDKVSNNTVLERTESCSSESLLIKAQLRWTGHVLRMPDTRIPKRLLYGELSAGGRKPGGQLKRYKDQLKSTLKTCEIPVADLEHLVQDRSAWRALCHDAVHSFEVNKRDDRELKRQKRHNPACQQSTLFVCDVCQRDCHSRIGLLSHKRSHR